MQAVLHSLSLGPPPSRFRLNSVQVLPMAIFLNSHLKVNPGGKTGLKFAKPRSMQATSWLDSSAGRASAVQSHGNGFESSKLSLDLFQASQTYK